MQVKSLLNLFLVVFPATDFENIVNVCFIQVYNDLSFHIKQKKKKILKENSHVDFLNESFVNRLNKSNLYGKPY